MSSYFKLLKSLRTDIATPAFHDFMRSLPDSLMLGTGVFALVTQSFSMGILVLAIIELCIAHRFIGDIVQGVQGGNSQELTDTCTPGIPSPYQISFVGKILSQTIFPSGPVFLISGVIAYILSSTLNFKKELDELGMKEPEWKMRLPLSFMFSFLLLILFVFWRFANSCDGAVTLLGSVVAGLVTGSIIFLIHVYLFGRDSVNFLGIPLLADRAATGAPLYVGVKVQKKP